MKNACRLTGSGHACTCLISPFPPPLLFSRALFSGSGDQCAWRDWTVQGHRERRVDSLFQEHQTRSGRPLVKAALMSSTS